MIAIIDYQMGNLRSVQKAFERKGMEARITDDIAVLRDADGLVLPGVGAFGDCYRELNSRKLVEPILGWIESGRPFLGICLGLQVLFDFSEESGDVEGLKVIRGSVRRFTPNGLKVPHMGWNQVSYPSGNEKDTVQCPLFEGIPDGTFFYFVHSFYVVPDDTKAVSGWTTYGFPFASAIWRGNMFATQFHPEKSQEAGLRVIENFGRIASRARAQTPGALP